MSRIFRLLLVVPCLFAANANLANIKSIYVMPMTNGMDQYLANRLRTDQVVAITTDPQAADAVLTDSIGPAFERRLVELYPPPPPPEKPKKAEGGKAKSNEKDAEAEEDKGEMKETGPERVSSFRKGRGVVFLVDRRSRQVVWSTHERPKDSSSRELDRAAGKVSGQLKRDYGIK